MSATVTLLCWSDCLLNCGLKTVDRLLTKALWHLNTNVNPETIISTLIVYVYNSARYGYFIHCTNTSNTSVE